MKNPRLMQIPERIARWHMRSQISDPALLEKVSPSYTIGCKRILPSNQWYPALSQPNVELLTGGVERVTANPVVTGDGEEREVVAIIFGTGFQITEMPVGRIVRGPGGKTLGEVWQGSPTPIWGPRCAATVQVREDAAERFNADLDERMGGTVWNTGCASWYLDATGRNSMLWPDSTWRFRQRTASFDPADFELTQGTPGNPDGRE